jgi:hypothetical protein
MSKLHRYVWSSLSPLAPCCSRNAFIFTMCFPHGWSECSLFGEIACQLIPHPWKWWNLAFGMSTHTCTASTQETEVGGLGVWVPTGLHSKSNQIAAFALDLSLHEKGISNWCKDQLEMNQLGLSHMCTQKQC